MNVQIESSKYPFLLYHLVPPTSGMEERADGEWVKLTDALQLLAQLTAATNPTPGKDNPLDELMRLASAITHGILVTPQQVEFWDVLRKWNAKIKASTDPVLQEIGLSIPPVFGLDKSFKEPVEVVDDGDDVDILTLCIHLKRNKPT